MSTLKDALNSMLSRPQDILAYTEQINTLLGTEAGLSELKDLLIANFTLAYIYLPSTVNLPIDHGSISTFLIELNTTENNLFHIYNYIDGISNISPFPVEFTKVCISKGRVDLINAICMKYRNLSRSNDLFREIKYNIEALEPVFTSWMTSGESGLPDKFMVELFYSLVYQDIHPFFEDNLNPLFARCFSCYVSETDTIHRIFELFIVKYQELTNLDLIIQCICHNYAVCKSRDIPVVLNIVTKAYGYSRTHEDLITQLLFTIIRDVQVSTDAEGTSRALHGTDERAQTHELIKTIKPAEVPEDVAFYVGGVLKDPKYKEMAIKTVQKPGNNEKIAFDAMLYLINLKKYVMPSVDNFCTSNLFITCFYVSEYLKENSTIHLDSILRRINPDKFNLDFINIQKTIRPMFDENLMFLIYKVNSGNLDRFTSLCILWVYRFGLISDKDTLRKHCQEILLDFDIITERSTRGILFDIYIELTSPSDCTSSEGSPLYDENLISKIIKEQMADAHPFMVYYMSMNITKVDRTMVMNILQNNDFYQDRAMHMPLTCLLIAGVNHGILTRDQVTAVNRGLKSVTLAYRLSTGENNDVIQTLLEVNPSPEIKYLLTGVFDEQMIGTYLDKKYCRAVIKKAQKENMDGNALKGMLTKNKKSLEYEYTLHSVTKHFDL